MVTFKSIRYRYKLTSLFFLGLCGMCYITQGFAQTIDASNVYGSWLTGNATVNIRDCGNGSPCGYITKVDAKDRQNDPLLDVNNPKQNQRTNTLVGTRMIHGFKLKKGYWKGGRIYNPANGKTYSSSIKLETQTRLSVKGCIGPFCQTQIWVREAPSSKQGSNNAGH